MAPTSGDKKSVLDLDEPDEPIEESGVLTHPTLKPAFDPKEYAREHASPIRDRAMTLVDDDVTEQARIASVLIDSTPPPDPNGAPAIRARLAPMSRVPILTKSLAELGASIDEPKTAYVLGFVDGVLPLETIVDVVGLPEVETLHVLERFVAQGVITFVR